MAQQIINIGAAPNDGGGDQLRASFNKCNDNFTELYAKGATEGLWNYNKTSTDTSTTPVSGRFKTNSGNYRDATQIAIHAITIQGIDRTSTLRAMLVGDIVQCQDSTNSAAWCRFGLQSLPVDHGTWFQLNVALETDGGVASGDNQEIVFVFTASSGGSVDLSAYATLASPIFTGDPKAPTPATADNDTSIATTAYVQAQGYLTSAAATTAYQPLDADLTSLAAAAGTNTIYYRSAANTWSAVTVSTGLAFSGGNLTATGGGGNVSNVGTPTNGQFARWTTATTIEGISPATALTAIGAQPLDGDLTAIAALAGTNNIYYRSAADTWTAVTVGTGLSFSAGTLANTVSTSGLAPLASPVFTGDPTAPTATAGDNDTSIATTAFVTAAIAASGSGTTTPSPPQGRLTLQTLTPVMTTTQAAKTTIYYTPYVGNLVPIYNGTSMAMTTFAELSVATTDTTKSPAAIGASKCNDWYVWSDAGTLRIGHGPDWTSDTARSAGTALVMVNGIWLNNASITNGPAASRGTYVGTTRSNASSQLDWIFGAVAANGTAGFFGLANAYNREDVATIVADSTDSWTYATNAWRASNASNNMRVSYVDPLGTTYIAARNYGVPFNGSNLFSAIGIGVDSTTNYSGFTAVNTFSSSAYGTITAEYSGCPGLGFHYAQAIETVPAGGTSTFRGDNGTPAYLQSGMVVRLKA